MTGLPPVSIGLPVYNGGPFIGQALGSLLAQTHSDFELIISDNGSEDATETICREFAGRDPRVRYIRQTTNRGILFNYQAVLNEARSSLFMWASADDVWGPRFIEIALAELRSDADLGGAMVAPYDRPSYKSIAEGYIGYEEATALERVGSYLRMLPNGNVALYALWRRECVSGIFPEEAFAGFDWTMMLRAVEQGRVRVVYDAANGMYKRPGGVSQPPIESMGFTAVVRRSGGPMRLRKFVSSMTLEHRRRYRSVLLRLLLRDSSTMTFVLSRAAFRVRPRNQNADF